MAHHATVKKAADKGILFEDAPEGSDYRFRAFWPERSMELWGSNGAALVDNAIYARMLTLEHGIKVEQEDDQVTVSFNDHEIAVLEADLDHKHFQTALIDALDQITDEMREGAPLEEEGEDEETVAHSVVPEKYKNQYKEQGHPGNCGDWLAQLLIEHTTDEHGKLSVDKMDAIAQANGVDTAKWNRVTNGWQGRLRMTARNAMVKKVAVKGALILPDADQEVAAPEEWCRKNAPKVKEAGSKAKKAA